MKQKTIITYIAKAVGWITCIAAAYCGMSLSSREAFVAIAGFAVGSVVMIISFIQAMAETFED